MAAPRAPRVAAGFSAFDEGVPELEGDDGVIPGGGEYYAPEGADYYGGADGAGFDDFAGDAADSALVETSWGSVDEYPDDDAGDAGSIAVVEME